MKQALVFSLLLSSTCAFVPLSTSSNRQQTSIQMSSNDSTSRREIFSKILGGAALIASQASPNVVNALDMDAFINAELESDTKNCDPKRDPKCAPQLTGDEAMCKYGQGKARAQACKNLKQAGKDVPQQSQGKSLGGAYAM